MFYRFLILIILAFQLSGCIHTEPEMSNQEHLGYDFILALQNKDAQIFQQLFTKEYLKKMRKIGIQKVLNNYHEIFLNKYGKFKAEDFKYNYQGSDKKGKIYFFHNGERTGEKVVIKEKDKWVFESL